MKKSKTSFNKEDLVRLKSFSDEELRLFKEFLSFLRERIPSKIKRDSLPISVFKNFKLSPLETITKYLKEELDFGYNKIAKLLHRNPGPIGITYRNAKKKMPGSLDVSSTEFQIPISIFEDTSLSIFECLVCYLKEEIDLSFNKISNLLNRNYRTVWTVYSRAKKKRSNERA